MLRRGTFITLVLVLGMLGGASVSLAQSGIPMPYADYRAGILALDERMAAEPQPSGFPTVASLLATFDVSLELTQAELERLKAITPEDCYAPASTEYLALYEDVISVFQSIRGQLEKAQTVFDIVPVALAMDTELRSRHPDAYVPDPAAQSGYRFQRIHVLDVLGATCPGAPPVPTTAPPSVAPLASSAPSAQPIASTGPSPAAPTALVVSASGWSPVDADTVSVDALISNPNATSWAAVNVPYRVTVTDADGGVVSTSEGTLDLLLPGQSTAIGGSDDSGGGAAGIEVRLGRPEWRDVGGMAGGFTTSGVRSRTDEYGQTITTGRISQDLAGPVDDVEIAGGANGRTSFLDPTEDEPFQVDDYSPPKHFDETRALGRFDSLPVWVPGN